MAIDVSNGGLGVSPANGASAEKPTNGIRVEREHNVLPARPHDRDRLDLQYFDLQYLMSNYGQMGLLFGVPPHNYASAVARLEDSLSQVLSTFYPLAGRLATSPDDGAIYIDCNDAGVSFFEASAENISVEGITAADGTPVDQLFALNGAIDIEGHSLPLLAVQVTKLRDGIFVACSLNHSIADGATAWHFWNSWSEICRGEAQIPSISPMYNRATIPSNPNWSLVRQNLDLDTTIIKKFRPPPLRVKFFHFTREMLNALKDRANSGRKSSHPISTLQALCGHLWQSVTRARGLGPQDNTTFQLAVDCRSRLDPQLPPSYFGNAIQRLNVTRTAQEVTSNDVSFPAQLVHDIIQSHELKDVIKRIDGWEKNPSLPTWEKVSKTLNNPLHLANSPRSKVYETDFGWGSPLAARSGCANKIDGKVLAYPGREQEGSMDLELCLAPETMNALEIDQRFLNPLLLECT